MTEEELEREIAYNTGRIATKVVENTTHIRIDPAVSVKTVAMSDKIRSFIINHPDSVKRTAFIDTPRHAVYYYDFSEMYHTFQIPKRKGGFREICAPNDELKQLQHELMILFTRTMKFLPHNAAHGFTRKRNCKTSLEVHKQHGSRWFLKLDIKDFFPNTSFQQVYDAMANVYPFCTLSTEQRWLFTSLCTLGESTPQGAPTSPVVTNLVMVANDVAITKYCKEHGLIYTRYADDMLISSRVSFDWETVQRDIQNILQNYEIKEEKTRYGSYNGRNWNLGLMYNNQGEITVGHAKKQLVKNMIHNYLTKEEYKTHEYYYKLIGIVGYCNYIEPQYFNKYMEILKANRI